ncbi:L-lactate dehydrogenase [Candidatus Gracilibacteria bacterium]|nr:L-lactate dehydrogenase [Candidatus Gracilibacteria bacterium]MCF7819779.1 L-lactate dehydrogenase [Candidatus Gracilibacteria bacterium]
MKKVAIIGTGNVGAHIASDGIAKNLPVEFLLVDMNQEFETAQVLDLKDSLLFSPKSRIRGVDFGDKVLTEADVFIITAGANQKPGETRTELLERNVGILKNIVHSLGKIKKSAIVIIVSNPVDILTSVASQILDLPKGHVFGSGTLLDSARLRWRLAEKFDQNISDVTGFVLGEHGDSEFVAWSTVKDSEDISSEEKKLIARSVMQEAYEIIEGKGSTYFGIGAAVTDILDAILSDEKKILPVSVPLYGEYDLQNVSIGVPAKIGKKGIESVQEIDLSEEEKKQLHDSATKLKNLCPSF